jgi:SNARE associated Golgi protein.
MDAANWDKWLSILMALIQEYRSFGPLPGLLLPMLESFLPFLPLFVFVMANASAFGLGLGFLFSWAGTCTGSLLVFSLARKYGQRRFLSFLRHHHKVKRLVGWVERRGFGPLFLLLCFPFTPSAVVNIVAGMSKINFYQYALAVMAGKMVMIFTISYIGHDIPSLIQYPERTAIVVLIIFILWYAGKRIENHIHQRIEIEEKEREGERQISE